MFSVIIQLLLLDILESINILHARGIWIGICERQSRAFHGYHGTESKALWNVFGSISEQLIRCKHDLDTHSQGIVAFIAVFNRQDSKADMADELRVVSASGDISSEYSGD